MLCLTYIYMFTVLFLHKLTEMICLVVLPNRPSILIVTVFVKDTLELNGCQSFYGAIIGATLM